jgi:hypothetical protein
MECPKGADRVADLLAASRGLASTGARMPDVQAKSLQCVWSGYPANGRSCQSNISEDVVIDAWGRELERSGERADRFFRFTWQNHVWLAYGVNDGRVRGVHCPAHQAEREARAFVADARLDEQPDEFGLYA